MSNTVPDAKINTFRDHLRICMGGCTEGGRTLCAEGKKLYRLIPPEQSVPDAPPPERIYLQVGEPDEFGIRFREQGSTWCEDRINQSDVEYVRADIAACSEAPAEVLTNAITKAAQAIVDIAAVKGRQCPNHGTIEMIIRDLAVTPILASRSEGEAAGIVKERERCALIAETVNDSIRDVGKFRTWITNPNTCLVPLSGGGSYALQEHVFDNSGCCIYCAEFKQVFAPADEVERALAELQTIYPDDDIAIKVSYESEWDRRHYWLEINDASETNADSVAELMQAVREWRAKEKR